MSDGQEAFGSRRLLGRPAPADYLQEWTDRLADPKPAAARPFGSVVIFRLGQTWWALSATALREIAAPTRIRRLPHRTNDRLRGLVNVRGELHVCLSLRAILREPAAAAGETSSAARFLVLEQDGLTCVVAVDAVDGIHEILERDVVALPAMQDDDGGSGMIRLVQHNGEAVSLIDEGPLFASIARSLG